MWSFKSALTAQTACHSAVSFAFQRLYSVSTIISIFLFKISSSHFQSQRRLNWSSRFAISSLNAAFFKVVSQVKFSKSRFFSFILLISYRHSIEFESVSILNVLCLAWRRSKSSIFYETCRLCSSCSWVMAVVSSINFSIKFLLNPSMSKSTPVGIPLEVDSQSHRLADVGVKPWV